MLLRLWVFGGGYTARAMVADSHPIAQPLPTSRNLVLVFGVVVAVTIIKVTAQTRAAPTLYAV